MTTKKCLFSLGDRRRRSVAMAIERGTHFAALALHQAESLGRSQGDQIGQLEFDLPRLVRGLQEKNSIVLFPTLHENIIPRRIKDKKEFAFSSMTTFIRPPHFEQIIGSTS